MDIKQFQVLQNAVQWAVDEDRRDSFDPPGLPITHDQTHWAWGLMDKSKIREIEYAHTRGFKFPYVAICPTAGCLAGNMALIAGDEFVVPYFSSMWQRDLPIMAEQCWNPERGLMGIRDRGIELAGLSEPEADRLFDGQIGVDDIVEIATEIAADHGYTLEIM